VSRKGWKQSEREAAALVGGQRFPANMGGPVDYESDLIVGQDKNVKTAPLAQVERWAQDIETVGHNAGKVGLLTVKRSAGVGHKTPRLVVMTSAMFAKLFHQLKEAVRGLPQGGE